MSNIPTKAEMSAALTGRIGEKLRQRFEQTRVAVCGLGGLGSNIAVALARAGIGELILIDFDKVDISNLNRQQYKAAQIGIYKTEALHENLMEITPYLKVTAHTEKIDKNNFAKLLSDADLICEAFDKAEEKSMLIDLVSEHFPNKYLVAASGMAGLGSGNDIVTKKVTERFYLCGDGKSGTDGGESLFAPRVMLCAAHQAQTVLRIIAEKFDV